MKTKTCSKCHAEKPVAEFWRRGENGYQSPCKVCQKKNFAARRAANPEKMREQSRRAALKSYYNGGKERRREKLYGISPEAYEEMLASQDNRCAICGEGLKEGRGTHVDHCHRTGRVRGLLCRRCNRGLGVFGDNEELLRRAASYLADAA